jgi:lactam utilization protein B
MSTGTGGAIPLAGASICVHGDNQHAVEMASAIRAMLLNARVVLKPFLTDGAQHAIR